MRVRAITLFQILRERASGMHTERARIWDVRIRR